MARQRFSIESEKDMKKIIDDLKSDRTGLRNRLLNRNISMEKLIEISLYIGIDKSDIPEDISRWDLIKKIKSELFD